MAMTVDEMEAQILKLDLRARARLAHALLESLDALSEEENEKLWVEEAQRRDAAIERGDVAERQFEDVLREARERLK